MAVRSSMYNLIDRVQVLVNDIPTVRYAGNPGAVFTAQDVQDALDRYMQRFRQYPMPYELTYANNQPIAYQDFIAPFNLTDWEEDAVFQSASYVAITPDAPNSSYTAGFWHFTTSYPPPVYMSLGKTYDVYAAASFLLRQWAATYKLDFDVNQAGTGLMTSQMLKMILQMAGEYEAKRRPQHIKMKRTDLGLPTQMPNWQYRDANKTPRTPTP